MTADSGPHIDRVETLVLRIPTDAPEADGTIEWSSTTMVIAKVRAGGTTGIGYTYAHAAAAALIVDPLRDCLLDLPASHIPEAWAAMNRALRNIGRTGVGLMAISAVDHALWDLQARLLDTSVLGLLGAARNAVAVYGSGGFTSYDIDRLQKQLGGWSEQGISRVKMKVGTDPTQDPARVEAARQAIRREVRLMVDANGAYQRKQALDMADRFAAQGVDWFEEPVPSDDLDGLHLLRNRMPAGMHVAAGEYGWDAGYFRRMLQANAVDVVQADSTRCGGFTGFLRAAAVARGFGIPLSAHCAPTLHAHVGAALDNLIHLEYFHDHVRIEKLVFDGVPELVDGRLVVDASQPGLGLTLREADVQQFTI